jgi:hypothetical protein
LCPPRATGDPPDSVTASTVVKVGSRHISSSASSVSIGRPSPCGVLYHADATRVPSGVRDARKPVRVQRGPSGGVWARGSPTVIVLVKGSKPMTSRRSPSSQRYGLFQLSSWDRVV